MNKYKFTTNEFGISETGIHLLRNKFNFDTIDFKEITYLEIRRGKLINNWFVILAIGIGLIGFSIFYTNGLINAFNDPSVRSIYIEEVLVPLLPFFFGGFCIYASIRNGLVLIIEKNGKRLSLPLEELNKKNEFEAFINYLNSTCGIYPQLRIYINDKQLA